MNDPLTANVAVHLENNGMIVIEAENVLIAGHEFAAVVQQIVVVLVKEMVVAMSFFHTWSGMVGRNDYGRIVNF